MVLIALTSIGCIIYLALGTVLTRAMFRRRQRERNLDLFFSTKKAQDVRRGEVISKKSRKIIQLAENISCALQKNLLANPYTSILSYLLTSASK
jgi:hypothetical protein